MNSELGLEMLRRMWLIRKFEEASQRLVETGEIGGEVHLALGQEAETVGAAMALRSDDYIAGNHRSHGHPLGKGSDPRRLLAELMGKATGVCRGKGGSMHLADFSVGSLGESGIVASSMPVTVGAALSSKLLGQDRVAMCFFGDGAMNEGACHEAMNLASIWDLPVVWVCENNMYAVSMAVKDITAVAGDLADRASAYDMPGVVVDGQNVGAVYDVAVEAVERARSGGGPTLIEAKTYRFDEHAFLLPLSLKYRSDEEIDDYRQNRDPIRLHEDFLLSEGLATRESLESVAKNAASVIGDAIRFAEESPYPEPETRFEDLYANAIPIR